MRLLTEDLLTCWLSGELKKFWYSVTTRKYILLKDQRNMDHWHQLIVSPCYVYLIKLVPYATTYIRVVESIGITGLGDYSKAVALQIAESYKYWPSPFSKSPVIIYPLMRAHISAENFYRVAYKDEIEKVGWEQFYLDRRKQTANYVLNMVRSLLLSIGSDILSGT